MLRDGNGQPFCGWLGEEKPEYNFLPDMDYVYEKLKAKDCTDEQIIDLMVKMYHKQRLIRGDYLEDRSLVIGLVGNAGAGKSCGAAAITIYDYLLAGVPVFSNMDVRCTVRYREAEKTFQTKVIDDNALLEFQNWETLYHDVAVFIDEINMCFGDARRSMSNRNLEFADLLQQRRKRGLNIIYTVQDEHWMDARARFATDIFITCVDMAYLQNATPKRGELGRKSRWRVNDFSGIVTGPDWVNDHGTCCFFEGEFLNTAFWHSYDTRQLQQRTSKRKNGDDAEDMVTVRDGAELANLKEKYKLGRKVYNDLAKLGIEKLTTTKIWELCDCKDNRTMQSKIGRDLAALNVPMIKFSDKNKVVYFDSETYEREKKEYDRLHDNPLAG